MAKVTLYQGEAKSLPFRIKDKITGSWADLSGATFLLMVKRSSEDAEPVFIKLDDTFGKAGVSSGYLSLFLTAWDTWREPWTYLAELRIIRAGTPAPIGKLRFDLEILQAITPSDFTIVPENITSQEAFGAPAI